MTALGATITIELATHPTDEVRTLVGELEAILSADYPPEQRHRLSLDAIFQPHIRFFVARSDGTAVGCAGVALFDSSADDRFAEVKRMYVRDSARGTGVAPALLVQLESTARDAGYSVLRLETGTRQLAAIRFYERAGFHPCNVFGGYATKPAQSCSAERKSSSDIRPAFTSS